MIEKTINDYLTEVDPGNEVASFVDISDLAENVAIALARAGAQL